jgi:hypothetical protein
MVTSISTPQLIKFLDQRQQAYGLQALTLLVQLVPQALLELLDRLDLLVLQAPFQDQQDLQALLVPLAQ